MPQRPSFAAVPEPLEPPATLQAERDQDDDGRVSVRRPAAGGGGRSAAATGEAAVAAATAQQQLDTEQEHGSTDGERQALL